MSTLENKEHQRTMTLNRRDFVRAGLGWAAAGAFSLPDKSARSARDAADELDRWITTSHHVRFLGRPRSVAAVRQGFWPISPGRVLILRPHPWAGPENRWQPHLDQSPLRLRDELRRRGGKRNWQGVPDEKCWMQLSNHKLGLIARISSALASYYAVPELRTEWAYEMAAREGLGTTYVGSNVAQPHQFQTDRLGRLDTRTIRTDNEDIDHWLILVPGGTGDWDGWLEESAVHVMTTHIFPRILSYEIFRWSAGFSRKAAKIPAKAGTPTGPPCLNNVWHSLCFSGPNQKRTTDHLAKERTR
jgi:hypothetical protein